MQRRQTPDVARRSARAPAGGPRPSRDTPAADLGAEHLQARVRALVAELRAEGHSMRVVGQILGTSRETALSLLAGEPVTRGTIATVLLRQDSGEIDRARRALRTGQGAA